MLEYVKKVGRFTLFVIIIFFGVTLAIFPQSDEQVFNLSYAIDIPVAAVGIGLFITDILLEPVEGPMQPKSDLFALDQLAVFEYNSTIDLASDILFYSSLTLPLVLLIDADGWSMVETATMFAETLLLSISVKNIIKDICPRWRPYTYFGISEDDEDYMNSFPSGHTTTVFAVCSFASYSYSKMYPDSKWKIPFFAGAYTLAATTAAFRVVSGSHFITDVIAGALIGSAIGIGVPLLHQITTKSPIQPKVEVGFNKKPSLTFAINI